MLLGDSIRENVRIAFEALRVSKLRSALTILGVVIGISTVMSMATLVNGLQTQIVHTIEIAGPTTFYVMRVFSQTPLNPAALPKWVRIRPVLDTHDADAIARLPEIAYASLWAQALGRLEYAGTRSQPVSIFGSDDHFTEIMGGDLSLGRWFTPEEVRTGASVVVVNEKYARQLFGRTDPLDQWIRVGGRPARVIGIYIPPDNIFTPPSQETGAIVPYRMVDQQLTVDRTNGIYIPVKPRANVTVDQAEEAVTMTLRVMRKLHPADKNTFDLITQEQILDLFNSLTSVFFLVMMVLSSVALLVGGIGVMAIMMVSVTGRTREIGVRKALGASRRDILLQFLTEAATLTGIGGVIGILTGLAIGRLLSGFVAVTAPTPVGQTIAAVIVSVGIGVVFGIVPARRAARMDPVESLRYE